MPNEAALNAMIEGTKIVALERMFALGLPLPKRALERLLREKPNCGCQACRAFDELLRREITKATAEEAKADKYRHEISLDVSTAGSAALQAINRILTRTAGPAPAQQEAPIDQPETNATKKDQDNKMTTPTATPTPASAHIDVERDGDKIVVPPGISIQDAIAALTRRDQEDSQVVSVSHTFKMTASEGVRLFLKALGDLHGFVSPTRGVTMIAVDVGPNKTESVAWGPMKIPGIDGDLLPDLYPMNGLYYFCFGGKVKGRDKAKVDRIAEYMREIAGTESLYRGKAIRVSFPDRYSSIEDILPKFMDTDKVNPESLIFSKDVEELINVTLLTPIEHSDACRKHGISLKRGILLEGPFGVGKTLTAAVTARKCVENGWTFILLDDVAKLSRAIEFARQYQPAVIFAEDIDQILKDEIERDDRINAILNQIDGIESKGSEVITVLTTNDVEGITQAMLRPGRIDSVIPVRAPDADAAVRLVRMFAGSLIRPDEDLSTVGPQLEGMIPASIAEVVNRSKLAAVLRAAKTGGDANHLIASDISVAAKGMAQHLELLQPVEVDERSDAELAAEILGDKLADALTAAMQPKTHANGASQNALASNVARSTTAAAG